MCCCFSSDLDLLSFFLLYEPHLISPVEEFVRTVISRCVEELLVLSEEERANFRQWKEHDLPSFRNIMDRIIAKDEEVEEEAPKLKIAFAIGDHVKINEGTFENFEGDVNSIDEQSGRITVMINIFGRSTPVELEHWQIESL